MSPGGVPGTTRMVDVTDDEWRSLCDWHEDLRGDEPPVYSCEGTEVLPARCEPMTPPCWTYDWSASTCYDWVAGTRLPWRRASPDCEATVADWAACVTQLAELVCHLAYAPVPECEALERCRTGAAADAATTRDAG